MIPMRNRNIVGKNIFQIPIFVFFSMAGEMKPYISLTIIGMEPINPINTETYIWEKNACPGAVCISFTSGGSKVSCIYLVI
jgi:hypothetical protein